MSTPRVSVVVPVRDRRALLRRCLAALAAQTFTDFEVVVVDDGSTDGSGDEAEAATAAGQPVRVIRSAANGAVAARGAGVTAARGEVLAFTDSDCEPEPTWLAGGVAAIDGGADVVQGRTEPVRGHRLHERTVWVTSEDGLYATCNVFYRREAFERAGGFEPGAGGRLGFGRYAPGSGLGFGEDTMLGWRVRRSGRSTFADGAVVRHAVFGYEPAEALRRSWLARGFPALVREVPELRVAFLRHRLLLGGPARLALYPLPLALVAGRRPAAGFCVGCWLVGLARRVARHETRWRGRMLVASVVALDDLVVSAALLVGSVRARSLVL